MRKNRNQKRLESEKLWFDPIDGQWPVSPKTREEYCKQVSFLLGGSFGRVRRPSDDGPANCLGNTDEIQAWMRTRLVSPDWIAVLYRFATDLPNPSDTASCYMQNTKVYYQCTKCKNPPPF
jgi:hypothetical protein